MNTARYVVGTISRLMTARLLYRGLFAGSVILVSNYLITDPALLDIFDVASASVSVMMIMSEVGMSMVLMRSGTQQTTEKFQRYYGTALWVETVTWITLLLSTLGVYALANGLTTMFWMLLVLGIGQAAIQYRVVFRSIYRSLYKKEWITFIEVIDGALKLLGVYLIIQWVPDVRLGVYYIAGLFSLTTIMFVAIYGFSTIKLVRPKLDLSLLPSMFHEGIWFSLQALVMTIYFEIDKLMLRLFQTTGWADIPAGDIGRYSAAARIVIFLLIFHRLILQVITPYLYANYEKNMDRYRQVVNISTRYLGALGIGMGIGLIMVGDQIIQLLYKPDLWSAIPALQWFGVVVAVRFIGITSSQVFATSHQQPLRTKLEFLSILLNIGLNIWLIPIYGFMGCVYATVITEAVLQIGFFILSRRSIQAGVWKPLIDLLPAFGAGIVLALAINILKQYVPIGLTISAGVIVYLLMLYVFRFIRSEDMSLFQYKHNQK